MASIESSALESHAQAVLASINPDDKDQETALRLTRPEEPLVERLDEFVLDESLVSGEPNVAQFPPEFKCVFVAKPEILIHLPNYFLSYGIGNMLQDIILLILMVKLFQACSMQTFIFRLGVKPHSIPEGRSPRKGRNFTKEITHWCSRWAFRVRQGPVGMGWKMRCPIFILGFSAQYKSHNYICL